MSYGKLYLIPTPLGEGDPAQVLPASVLEVIPTLTCFVVEEVRTGDSCRPRGSRARLEAWSSTS